MAGARTDDLIRGESWSYEDPVALHCAWTIEDVRPALQAVAQAARSGHWSVGFVAYEAANAFDAAHIRSIPLDSVPLVCFVEFRCRRPTPPLRPVDTPPPFEWHRVGGSSWFERGVDTIRCRIAAGDVYQVNLTDRLWARFDGEPHELYRHMALAQRGSYNTYLDIGSLVVVSASPELFFDFDSAVVVAKPMKGTATRRARPDDDERARDDLVGSAKDRAENVMIVDLLRNDLSRVAMLGGVSVPRLFDAERYETVWQLTSTVEARVRPGTSFIDVLAATFPCGSVTGAPKVAATTIIDELEATPRGVYCGAVGVVAPNPIDPHAEPHARFNVAIRTAVIDRVSGTVHYGAGGGITYGSDPRAEDAELQAKTSLLNVRRPEFDLIETLRIEPTGPRHLALHLARLERSATYFGFPCDRAAIQDRIIGLDVQAPGRLRILVSRDGHFRVEVTDLDDAEAEVTLGISSTRIHSDDPFCCHKTTVRDHYGQARAECPTADDVIMVNQRDELVETTVASLLYRRDGHWFTPPLTCGGLDGIGRRLELQSGSVTERVLRLEDLDQVEAFAVVSSLRGRRRARLITAAP